MINVLQSTEKLNNGFIVVSVSWVSLGGVVLEEVACHWGWA